MSIIHLLSLFFISLWDCGKGGLIFIQVVCVLKDKIDFSTGHGVSFGAGGDLETNTMFKPTSIIFRAYSA